MNVSAVAPERRGGLSYKWIVTIVIVFGMFMTILDSTIVNIAITRLQTSFGASLNDVQWVVTGYTLAQGIVTPLTAYFANRFGTKRTYIVALTAFTIGSALCGLAWSLPLLIFFRLLQGMGGALISPLAITMLYSVFPPKERGLAMGVMGMPILLAPAIGPTLGGYLVTYVGWQVIFFINVPIGIVGIIAGFIFLREVTSETRTTFDILGFVFSASGLGLMLYGLSSASSDGWGSSTVIGCLAIGIVLLVAFIFVELEMIRRDRQPLLDLRVFKDMSFVTSNIAIILVTFALYGGLFITPLYLQAIRQLSAYQAGLIMFPSAIASMVAIVISGRIVDRFGVKVVAIPGLLILAWANWVMTRLTLYEPYSAFQFVLIMRGFGLGLCMQPFMVSALVNIKPRMLTQASSTLTVMRFVFGSVSVAIIATLMQSQTNVHYAHLAELVTPQSTLGHYMLALQAHYVALGANLSQALSYAARSISGLLQEQAYLLAMQDTFWLGAVLSIAAILTTFFVRSSSNADPVDDLTLSEEERAEAMKAREEAMMAG
ncbi:MAG TPA: DHA2 family efflux MFS transporter permease subunit [Ktedonobacteraceae bacterium]